MNEIAAIGYDPAVVDAIVRWADAHDLPPIALLALGLQESNLNPGAVGDDNIGGSYGVFQIYLAAHSGSPDTWQGLAGLTRSMDEMAGRWHSTFVQHGGWSGWIADLYAFQEAWSPDAQGSIAWNPSMARDRVGMALRLYIAWLKGQALVPHS